MKNIEDELKKNEVFDSLIENEPDYDEIVNNALLKEIDKQNEKRIKGRKAFDLLFENEDLNG